MNTLAHFLNPLLMVLMPLALGAFLARRLKVSWGLFFVGAAAFIGSQILHIPFNAWVLGPALESLEASLSEQAFLIVTALALGLSAGVFEETARYLAIRSRKPRQRTWRNALMIGTGHGGAESILLGILVFYAFFQAVALRGADLAAMGLLDEQPLVAAQLAEYWSAPWYLSMLGALERVSAITIQITLTVLVLQVFLRRNWLWLGVAIGLHTLANAVGLLALQHWGPYWAEVILFALAVAGVWIIFRLRTPNPPEPMIPAEPAPTPAPPSQQKPHTDQLEDSRYV